MRYDILSMMGSMAGAGLLLSFSAPAQAADPIWVQWDFRADLTRTEDNIELPAPIITPIGLSSLVTIQGYIDNGPYDLPSWAGPVQPPCNGCVWLTIAGDTAIFDVDPASVPSYGYSSFSFTFDHDLGGNLLSATTASFVSGQWETVAGGTGGYVSYEGPIASLRIAPVIPEPATWALLVTGFAGIGGAMRGRQRRSWRLG